MSRMHFVFAMIATAMLVGCATSAPSAPATTVGAVGSATAATASSTQAAAKAATTAPAKAATLEPIDMCTLVTEEEARALLGAQRVENVARGTECVYDDNANGSRVFVQQSRTARSVQDLRDGGLTGVDNKPWTDVSGVGSAAVRGERAVAFLKGDRIIVVGFTKPTNPPTADVLIELAKKAAGRTP